MGTEYNSTRERLHPTIHECVTMFEQSLVKFVFDFLLLLTGLAGGALALWTWQKGYWEYQLRRQTDDWKARQSYSRKEARRQAMEGLLTELNEAMERHLIATYHTVSAMTRQKQHAQVNPTDEAGQAQWQAQVDQQVTMFNESERDWLVQSAFLEGKLQLHFADADPKILKAWPGMSDQILQFCELLNRGQMRELLEHIIAIRAGKDRLLQDLQWEIDRFTAAELELASVRPRSDR
jgi:hypothetical protein